MQTILIGSDHGGYELKEHLKDILTKKQYKVDDVGCFSKESCDYPDFGFKVASEVGEDNNKIGILVCTSGIGMSMVANKVAQVRAALCYNKEAAMLSRQHNNANVLVLGSKFVSNEESESILNAFLETEFEGGRHKRRVDKIEV